MPRLIRISDAGACNLNGSLSQIVIVINANKMAPSLTLIYAPSYSVTVNCKSYATFAIQINLI